MYLQNRRCTLFFNCTLVALKVMSSIYFHVAARDTKKKHGNTMCNSQQQNTTFQCVHHHIFASHEHEPA